ncbi:hypothetical protein ACFSX9_02495 [Flavobacterium ardleyense]|uniref:Lipoprotein n=1 Tax=Flavobacterium ardleyense TaxID=2038737 RepID=A0ABW5Z622_9FLAO
MKNLLTASLLISLLAVSCKKEETQAEITTDATTESKIIIPVASPENTNVVQEVQNSESNMLIQPTANSGAINPAHGQPGHRCEIPVGAPLNTAPKDVGLSKSTTNTTQPTTTNVQPNAPQLGATNPNGNMNATSSQVITPAGMNPPHGQEGHSCSIAVGAPLPAKN